MGFGLTSILTVAGTVGGAAIGGPAGALVGGSIGSALGTAIEGDPAARQQERALRAAGRIEEAEALRTRMLQQQFLRETAGFRELAREQIPLLREEALAEPGTSPLFQRGLQQGITGVQRAFAPRGLAGSSAEALATGELGAGLLSQDVARISGLRAALAGLGTTGFGEVAGLSGIQAQLAQLRAQTQANIGGVQAAGTQAQAGALSQLGSLYYLSSLLGGGAGAGTGGVPPGAGAGLY